MARYNHAMTVAFEVISIHEDGPTLDEAWEAFLLRVRDLQLDEEERYHALMSDAPFDTYEMDDECRECGESENSLKHNEFAGLVSGFETHVYKQSDEQKED